MSLGLWQKDGKAYRELQCNDLQSHKTLLTRSITDLLLRLIARRCYHILEVVRRSGEHFLHHPFQVIQPDGVSAPLSQDQVLYQRA